jgi:hypothetical protein
MTRNKSKRGNANNVSSMAVVRNNAALLNPPTRSRMGLVIVDELAESTQVLSQSQSPGPVGSQYTVKTLTFQADQLSPNFQDWIQQHDVYRISEAEIYATLVTDFAGSPSLRTSPVTHYCFEDPDTDPSVTTSWIRCRDRANLSRVVLRANAPSALIAKLKPRPSYSATGTQNPGNLIGKPGAWLDSLNLSQIHAGLRTFSYCPYADTSGQTYSYAIFYSIRIKVDCKVPI